MKLKIYLSVAWMCSEFGDQRPMSNKKGLNIFGNPLKYCCRIKSNHVLHLNCCFRKKALCEETLKVLDKLQPGYSCRRGMILYEYHTVLLVLGVTGRKESKKFLKNSLKYLRECLSILQLQSSSTFAGQLYQAVNSCAKDIENSIKNSLQNC